MTDPVAADDVASISPSSVISPIDMDDVVFVTSEAEQVSRPDA